jgi:hypothetical protein
MINAKNNNTTLNSDLTNVLVDNILESTASIMYIRQATYFYLIKLNGWSRADLNRYIRNRAKLCKVDLNRGVLSKESAVADYCITQKSTLFNKVDILTDKKESFNVIKKIADIMRNNQLKYNSLKDILTDKKESSKEESSEEESSKEESSKVESISLNSVIKYIKQADSQALTLIIATAESMLQDKKESSKKQKSKKAA